MTEVFENPTLQKVSEEFDKMKIDIDLGFFCVAKLHYKYWIQLVFMVVSFAVQEKHYYSEDQPEI